MRRDSLCGRLVAMPTLTDIGSFRAAQGNSDNFISIDFPAMPDTIELARTAEYNVSYSLPLPDGIHQYKGTRPLDIPISFRLHSLDAYCTSGSLSLIEIAARLHSFVLPISTLKDAFTVSQEIKTKATGSGTSPDHDTEAAANKASVWAVDGVTDTKGGALYSPVTCWLQLMRTTDDLPGISAFGYVREVKVTFNGPWLRGSNGSFNLPTSADYSFTFVHNPGYSNSGGSTSSTFKDVFTAQKGAFADDVKNSFYNTTNLGVTTTQGFSTNSNSAASSAPPALNIPIGPTVPTNSVPARID